jgi:hypothetical protein
VRENGNGDRYRKQDQKAESFPWKRCPKSHNCKPTDPGWKKI